MITSDRTQPRDGLTGRAGLEPASGADPASDRAAAASSDLAGAAAAGADLEISDEELTALALAADPDQPLGADATPLALFPVQSGGLPSWYMPPVMLRGSGRWRTGIIVAVVAALLLINALGLCITYGQLGAA